MLRQRYSELLNNSIFLLIPGVICRVICNNMLTAISSYYWKDYWSEKITSWNVVHENRFLCFIGKLLQYYMDNDDISIMVETTTATFVLFHKVYKENQSPYFNSSILRTQKWFLLMTLTQTHHFCVCKSLLSNYFNLFNYFN